MGERREKMDMRRGVSRAAVVFVVVAAAALLHVESAVGQGVPEDSVWYFTETEIGVPFRPSDYQPGANILNRVEEVVAFCPFGFVSSGCIASTVPPAIANIEVDGPVDFTRSGPLLSVEPDAEVSGFTVYTGCSATARFNTVINTEYVNEVAQSGEQGPFFTVFLKVQAFCVPAYTPLPSPPPLGCQPDRLCASETVRYVEEPCPGFLPSTSFPGLFYQCVNFGSLSEVCG